MEEFTKDRYTGFDKGYLDFHKIRTKKTIGFLSDVNGNFLDIGCGDGSISLIIQNSIKGQIKLYGVDISPIAVEKANKKGIEAHVCDIDKKELPFKNEFFDAVYCGEIIEHLIDPDHLLEEVYRVLRRNGVLILSTPNLASWTNRVLLSLGYQPFDIETGFKKLYGNPFTKNKEPVGHIRCFTLKALKELLKDHGFEIVKATGVPFVEVFGANMIDRLISKILPTFSTDILIKAFKR